MDRTIREQQLRILQRIREAEQVVGASRLTNFAKALFSRTDLGLTCEQCQAMLPAFADGEMSNVKPTILPKQVKAHLLLCTTCLTLYSELVEISVVEKTEGLPKPPSHLRPDLSFLPQRL